MLTNQILYKLKYQHLFLLDEKELTTKILSSDPNSHISKIFEAYVNEDNTYVLKTTYNGLIIPDSYYDFTLNCKNKCATCDVCNKIAEEHENKKDLV